MEHFIHAIASAFILSLISSITLYNQVLDRVRRTATLISIDHPNWLQRIGTDAFLLFKRIQDAGRGALLSALIGVERTRYAISCAGSAGRANSMFALALLLRMRFARTGQQRPLAEAIDLFREAWPLERYGYPDKSALLDCLADLLLAYFNQTGEESLLIQAVDINREALSLRSLGHPERFIPCNNLAKSLWIRFNKTGEESLLAEAIDLYKEALSLHPAGHPEIFKLCNNLASSLQALFDRTGQVALLAEAIDLRRKALSLLPTGYPDRSMSCNILASSLWTCFKQAGEESMLIEAIDLSREALSLCPAGHPGRSISCNNLASSLQTLFDQRGQVPLLAEAIDLHREALSLRPFEHPDRSISCINLASSLWIRFNQTGDEALLIEAIDLNREAQSLRPAGHPHRFISCNNLALSLLTRFEGTGEESLLAESIDLRRETLSLCPAGHPGRSNSCDNLAVSLLTRFKQAGEESLLVEAIDLHREALSLRPAEHPDRSSSCSNLALSLRIRFKQVRDESLLIEAINLHREALSLCPAGRPLRSLSCNNLAESLWTRFEQTGEESLLAEAIDLHREALSLRPTGHPDRFKSCSHLAHLLWIRYVQAHDPSLLSEAITLNNEAVESQPVHDPRRWEPVTNLIRIYLDPRSSEQNLVSGLNYLREAVCLNSDNWPGLLSSVAELTSLIDLRMLTQETRTLLLQCFSATFDLASRVAGFLLGPETQLRYLADSHHLGPRAYWCAIASEQSCLGLELMERARAIIWTQALHMQSPELSGAPLELSFELEHLLRRMNVTRALESSLSLPLNISTSSPALSAMEQDERYRNSLRINQIIEQIRAIPGHERFMRGLPFKELAQCASQNPVVVLIATEGECHALILKPNEQAPFTIKLSNIEPAELQPMSIAASARMRGSGLTSDLEYRRGMKAISLKTCNLTYLTLEKLWTTVVKPVIHGLRLQKNSGSFRPRLHWCPTGPFTSLPLHAAGIYGVSELECCADYVVSSYTPTLMALLRAQQSSPSFHKHDVTLGLIAAMKAWDTSFPPLGNVEDEIFFVRAAAEKASISVDDSYICLGDEAIVDRTAEVFQYTNLAHIACHGIQLNANEALSSGFCLTDGNLSVSRLMSLDLKDAFFAFLSACETAKGDEKQPDQTIHLAAAMLFVGFRSVVATMWAMNDADGPIVAKLFYEKLFAEGIISLDAIPYALDYAVGELRKSGASPERWATFIHMGA